MAFFAAYDYFATLPQQPAAMIFAAMPFFLRAISFDADAATLTLPPCHATSRCHVDTPAAYAALMMLRRRSMRVFTIFIITAADAAPADYAASRHDAAICYYAHRCRLLFRAAADAIDFDFAAADAHCRSMNDDYTICCRCYAMLRARMRCRRC